MNRRQFIRISTTASVAMLGSPLTRGGQSPSVSARIAVHSDRLVNKIGEEFTGLSYESAQLGNPQFFAGDNTELVGFVRRLGSSGVLRIGGNTSEYCYWKPNPQSEPRVANSESMLQDKATPIGFGFAVGPDTGRKAPSPVNITPAAVRNLREFLDATGWKLVYGLNMGTGSVEDAAAEAAFVMDVAGPKLLAFQLCNEPDLFDRNGLRHPDYNFAQFADEWQRYFQTIRSAVHDAPFAGPDTAYNNDWLVPFARRFKHEVRFLSQHYYAEGPPTDPSMTIARLLTPNPKLQQEFEGMKQTMRDTGLPFRLAETNSCFQGGKPAVSNTFASALWAADLMYQLAAAGGEGINFHGGGYGWYTPIAGSREHGFLARPIYYGMLLFAEAGPGQLVDATVESSEPALLLTAYAVRTSSGALKVAVFNKTLDRPAQVAIDIGQRSTGASVLRLFAPRVDDTTDTTFGGAPVGASGSWSASNRETLSMNNATLTLNLPATTAALITFDKG